MVKTRKFVEGDNTLATKAVWDDELTLIFCELCMNEVNAGNRPTTHLNSKGWENVVALFQAKTQKNYGKPQLKNKWDTLKRNGGIGWCPSKKTVDATEEWWAKKIQDNPDFKGFKKKGIEPRLNDLMWQMFGGIVATGENAWAPSSGVLPSGVPIGDDTPNEGFGDSNENSNENESIPPNEVPSNPPRRKHLGLYTVMDEFNNMYNSFYMTYDTPELSEEAQRRIATIVTQVEHNNYHEEEEQVLSSVLLHHETYFTKQPCIDSNYTGQMWVDEVLNGHDGRCMNSFRMPKYIFHSLLHDLQTNYGLKHGNVSVMEKLALSLYILGNRESNSNAAERFQRSGETHGNVSVMEKLALSLYILGNRESNSNAAERFQRSGETVSRIFTDMLHIFARMGIDTIKPTEGQFEEVSNHIRHDTRYWPHFKDCIRAIDGTHIKACISPSCQIHYIGRKGEPTQNIMAVCDFNMCFIFAFPGWEGTTHDSRIFLQALRKQELKFPYPPPG
ncbi:hypothetical protein GOBAR_AA09556 [Gossypium barbadense]|uniref:Myb/SANT-like domain-containing protein n=1 Tax=Gossypium barbadense TaxID=3634 RepID=A0A2P5Y669_GOSBA|nr:hypothetical protein GOBAR_AA09556 [Gossypium barbadense]